MLRIGAAALNPLDAKIATGSMTGWFPVNFPYVPGTDVAGRIAAVGEEVRDLAVGDLMFGRADPGRGGALAEAIAMKAGLLARIPAGVSVRDAACLPTPAGIAAQVLRAMARKADERLLVLGDGAVAQAAAALAGGAAWLVSDPEQISGLRDVRFVLDAAGGSLQRKVIELLPRGADLVSIVTPADEGIAAARGVRVDFAVLATDRTTLEELGHRALDGTLRVRIDHVLRLEEAALAFDRYVARTLRGKIVIEAEG